MANVFEGKDPRTDDKEGFLKLASKSAGDAVNLWSSFSEHLSSFEERWNILMTRDLSYETLLHEPGTDHAIIPWVSEHNFPESHVYNANSQGFNQASDRIPNFEGHSMGTRFMCYHPDGKF